MDRIRRVGQQFLDGGNHSAQILQFGRDDDLGGLAVGHLGQGFQAPQRQDFIRRLGLVQKADGIGLGLLNGQDGLGLTFGLQNPLLLDGVGPQDGGFLFALGGGDGATNSFRVGKDRFEIRAFGVL